VSYASYRVAALMQELVHYAPDLFIAYLGQNEFLERRTYQGLIEANPGLTRLGGLASRTRIYALTRAVISSVHPSRKTQARTKYQMTGEVDALLDVSGGLAIYTRDDTLQQRIAEHYAFNLHRLVRTARSVGAQVIFVVPASNYKDCSPFKSQHDTRLAASQRERCDSLTAQGARAALANDLPAALAALQDAAAIDPRYAETTYRLGQVQLELGKAGEAAVSFQRAIDEDICPLRQPTPLRNALRGVAVQEQVPLVDFPQLLQDSTRVLTGQRILGNEYFLDHVHPTIAGHRILAVALAEQIFTLGLAKPEPDWHERAVPAATQKITARVDLELQARGLRNVAMIFNWAGKTDEAVRLAARITQVDAHDDVNLVIRGHQASAKGDRADAIEFYRQALAANPNNLEARCNLAIELSRLGRHTEAVVEYNEVLKSWSDQWLVHFDVAYSYLKLGRTQEALDHFAQVVALRQGDPRALVTLAAAYAEVGQRPEAIRTGEQAIAAWRQMGQAGMAEQMQGMIAGYKAGRPWDARLAIKAP
jgi:tetratricopeptide (TPR) repeat protein